MTEKVFRDTRTQIGILKSRGVIIKNKKFAKSVIRSTGYYNLINGYKDPFLKHNTAYEAYNAGTTIEEIYALYEFDRKLRILTLEFILELEKQVKALIAYTFSREHGHRDYLRIENFDSHGQKKYEQVCKLLSDLYKKISLNADKEPSVAHYVGGKNYVPLWVLVNAISMGDLSKLYSNMIQKERNEVARRLKWGVRENELESCLYFLSSIRTRCAHDERLYSFCSHVELRPNKYFSYFRSQSRKNYFAVLIAFKMLLTKKQFDEYAERLDNLFAELSSHLKSVHVNRIYRMMGIAKNWRKVSTL